jgi:hypothetical protein
LKAHAHAGVDIGAPEGTPVQALGDGVVVKSEFQKGATGGIVTVRYADGTEAKYMHLSDTTIVKPGQKVTAGQLLGLSGYSPAARSSGAHLHYELRDKNGRLLDPLEYHGWGSSSRGYESARGTQVVAGQSFGGGTAQALISTTRQTGAVPYYGVSTGREILDEGRQQMDQAAARQFFHHRVRGTGKIDVTVGETKGQQSTEQAGPFKKIPWHRHQQMTPAEHGPSETKEMTGGEGPGAGPG